jgi:hypothetical protein
MQRLLATTLGLTLGFTPVFAGSGADFDAAYDKAYASYRTALFATNTGDATKSVGALKQLDSNWTELMAAYRLNPPPQFEADPLWGQTAEDVTSLLEQAKAQSAVGDLPIAHETLEGIRDALGSLHARNHVETFSDRMNAYHSEMEVILGIDTALLDAATKQRLLEHSAVLAYLAKDVLLEPPVGATGAPEFAAPATGLQASVDQFVAAARSGEDMALLAAIAALKVPYSKLFLKFG